jgi:thioredoxin-like negative regulator of GroEL
MIKDINTIDEFKNVIQNEEGALIYFSHQKCNVCKVLKPKIANLLSEHFPKIKMYYSDTELFPEVAAQNSIFTVPTILIFFDKKEFVRKSRNIGIAELRGELERPYNLMFN